MSDQKDAVADESVATASPVTTAPPTDDVADKLKEFGATDDVVSKIKEFGVTSVDDLSLLTEANLSKAGFNVIQTRKLMVSLKPVAPASDASVMGTVSYDTLPSVPDDGSWLEMLKTGGVLKVDQSTVISTIRAALAQRVGLYDVPNKLAKAMEEFADRNEEPVDPSFFKLRKQLIKRSYADVFEAIEGLDGTFVTEARKEELFRRMGAHFWPALESFNAQLNGWRDNWMQNAVNPGMLMMTMAGGAGVQLPPGMMQPPDTAALRDAADAVADAINKVFAGTGVPVASAMAYDATQIRKSIEDPRLPALIGAANRDQMLKQLGVAVPATYPRLEVNLTRFVIGVMEVNNQPSGTEELRYFGSLVMLGNDIAWPQLTSGRSGVDATLGGVAGRRSEPRLRNGGRQGEILGS